MRGISAPFYALPSAEADLEAAMNAEASAMPQFVAPLDPLLWGRDSLRRLWGFDYVWEVYKPPSKRRFGYYVLPVLYRDRFVGRFDGRYDRAAGTLQVISYHQEPAGLPVDAPALEQAFARFLRYLGGERIAFPSSSYPS